MNAHQRYARRQFWRELKREALGFAFVGSALAICAWYVYLILNLGA